MSQMANSNRFHHLSKVAFEVVLWGGDVQIKLKAANLDYTHIQVIVHDMTQRMWTLFFVGCFSWSGPGHEILMPEHLLSFKTTIREGHSLFHVQRSQTSV